MAHTSPLRSTEPGSAAFDVDDGAPVAVPELEPELDAALVPPGLVDVGEPDDCDKVGEPLFDPDETTVGRADAAASWPVSAGPGWPMDVAVLAAETKALMSLAAPKAGGLMALCAKASGGVEGGGLPVPLTRPFLCCSEPCPARFERSKTRSLER